MNSFFRHLLSRLINARTIKGSSDAYQFGKALYIYKVSIVHSVKDFFLILLGIASAGFGLESFLLPNSFIDGGVTGISLLVTEITKYPLPLLLVILNIPFILIGYSQAGRVFAFKSMASITGLAIVIIFIHFPVVTSDKLLVAVFGGFFLGLGIGFAVRGGGVLDGTEVLAIFLSKRTGLTVGDIVLVFNIVIFSVAAYLLSVEAALYSMLTYLVASKTVDFILVGADEYTGVTIISPNSEEIRIMITETLGHGVTIYNGQRGFGKNNGSQEDIQIIYTVLTRLEIAKLKTELDKIDPHTFMVMTPVKDTKGGMIKKRTIIGG